MSTVVVTVKQNGEFYEKDYEHSTWTVGAESGALMVIKDGQQRAYFPRYDWAFVEFRDASSDQ